MNKKIITLLFAFGLLTGFCYGQNSTAIPITGTPATGYVPTATSANAATWQASGAANGVQFSLTTTHVFTGGSTNIVATIRSTTATAVSCNGTTCTITDTQSYTAGQWVQFQPSAGFSPSCLNWSLVQVSATGLSGTSFQVSEAQTITPGFAGCTGTVSGTGGAVQDATNFFPFQAGRLPYFTNGGTITPTIVDLGIPGDTIAAEATNYTARYHSNSPAVVGHAVNLYNDAGGNDLAGGATAATMMTNYQSFWTSAHADGYVITQSSLAGGPAYNSLLGGPGNAQYDIIRPWLLAQQCTAASTSTACYDHIADVGTAINNNQDGNLWQLTGIFAGHYTDAGATLNAVALNQEKSAKQSINYGGLAGLGSNDFTGFQQLNGSGGWFLPSSSFQYNSTAGKSFFTTESGALLAAFSTTSGSAPDINMVTGSILGFNNRSGGGVTPIVGDPVVGLSIDSTFSNTIAVGKGVTVSDATGYLHLGGLWGPTTAPSGSCTLTGQFVFSQDGAVTRCLAGTWTTFSGGGTTTNALTLNNSGSGATSGTTFNGSAAVTLSYNTLGAAPLASPTFTGTPAAPTATSGTSTTQLATTAFVQSAVGGASTGAGIVTYSGPALTLTGTLFLPIGGGALSSTTETNVDIDSPAAATVQNFSVQMSVAPGVGNTVVYTWRKNAASTAITCTISGASATNCNDLTHTLTVVQGDLLDIQVVTTGTIAGTPTVVMGTQFGIAASSGVSSVAATSPVTTTGATGAITLACATCTVTIASGTSAMGTSAIASGACATVVTTTATGVATTDAISWNPNASIKAVTGYTPSTSGGLTIAAYPTSGNVNFDVCNWTAASITPGAVTLNWRVVR